MKLFLSIATAVLLLLGALIIGLIKPVHAQQVGQQNSILYCSTGNYDAFGNPIVVPCGTPQTPVAVVVVPIQKVCQPNPLTGKAPPLC